MVSSLPPKETPSRTNIARLSFPRPPMTLRPSSRGSGAGHRARGYHQVEPPGKRMNAGTEAVIVLRASTMLARRLTLEPVSLPDAQRLTDCPVAVDVLPLQVIQEPAALANQHQQPSPRVVVLRVHLEVLGEIGDAL